MSWVSRSFLSRLPQPLLSRLRPVHRHASQQLASLFGRNNLIRSRKYASNPDGVPHAEAMTKRHLYVVLDDHIKDGYGIHKLDLGDHHDDLDDGGGARRLPEPPVRVALETVGGRAQFAGVGSSIVAIGATRNINCRDLGVVVVYDAETGAMAVTPDLPTGLAEDGLKAAMAVGNRLYMLESASEPAWSSPTWNGGGNVHCLTQDRGGGEGGGWSSWKALSYYSRWSWSDDCGKPLAHPFWAKYLTAYAARATAQQEHELLVSVRATYDRAERCLRAGTFSLSTASRQWTWRADWQLPAHGHAHYDGGLCAWLGLHAVLDCYSLSSPRVTDGLLCAGDVASAPREWKVGGEKLFRLDEDIAAGWRHLDAKLVPMAPHDGGGEYCLMERLLAPKGDKEEEHCSGENVGDQYEWSAEEKECLLRLTAFRVELGHDGELVATDRRPARSYRVSRYNRYFDAQAFWM